MNEKEDKTLKQSIIFWTNRLRLDVRVQKRGWFVQFFLHERFRPLVRAVKIVFTLIALISAFFSFQAVWVSFLFGVAIYFLTTVFEKIVFSYNSMYVHALPDFDIESEKWLGAFFGYAMHPKYPNHIPLVGWVMSDPQYARKVHSLLLRWSYGKLNDEDNNIRTSVIIEDNNEYIFFCYPDMDRKTAKLFFEAVERERKKTSFTDVHHRSWTMLVLGKRCQITTNSFLPTFRERYRNGIPYLFRLAVPGDDGQPQQIDGLDDFILFNLKIKTRVQLDRRDIEYDLLRIMG